jgi:energy-converting hydrogenase A subunit M
VLFCGLPCYEYVMAKLMTWKERQYIENWTKRVEVTSLYQLRQAADQMKERAQRDKDDELSRWSGLIQRVLAQVNGEITDFNLSKHELPESAVVNEEPAPTPPELKILKRHRP